MRRIRIHLPRMSFKGFLRTKRFSIPALVILIFLGTTSWSVTPALTAPGTDSVAARLAEWGRDHHLGNVITFAENLQYKLHPPKLGGKPDTTLLNKFVVDDGLKSQDIVPLVSPALPGEGKFKTVYEVNGKPALRIAYIRPDEAHTSYLAAIALMSKTELRFVLHPGFLEPGKLSNYKTADQITKADLNGLVATFNSGFKFKDSRGGFYTEGIMAQPLKVGSAAFVIYADGHADIGSWGKDMKMSATVESVRQNLSLLVDNSVVTPNLDENVQSKWGFTVKNAYYVARSGAGVTADGNIVYVAGNALSVKSLANVLQAAGAVRAMELDINPDWISYMWYSSAIQPSPEKLFKFKREVDRYLNPSSRDFFAVYARSPVTLP